MDQSKKEPRGRIVINFWEEENFRVELLTHDSQKDKLSFGCHVTAIIALHEVIKRMILASGKADVLGDKTIEYKFTEIRKLYEKILQAAYDLDEPIFYAMDLCGNESVN